MLRVGVGVARPKKPLHFQRLSCTNDFSLILIPTYGFWREADLRTKGLRVLFSLFGKLELCRVENNSQIKQ